MPIAPVESPDATTLFPYHDLTAPTLDDVRAARDVVSKHLPRTPLVEAPALSGRLGAEVLLKREDVLPTGAFKVRGGVHLASRLEDRFRDAGMVAASTGNHGQSVAFAGRAFDVPVTIVVPEDANPGKVAAIERYGADVIHRGTDFDMAREHAEKRAAEEEMRYVHSGNEPDLIAGVATAGLEVAEDRPDVDVVVCPVGGGSGASGYGLTVGAVLGAEVVGVQSEAAPAVHHAWSEGHLDPHGEMETFAEGLATRVPFALPVGILRERLDDFVLVTEGAIRDAVRTMLDDEHLLVEGAAAAALAGATELKDRLDGRTVVLPVTGRNLAPDKLAGILEQSAG